MCVAFINKHTSCLNIECFVRLLMRLLSISQTNRFQCDDLASRNGSTPQYSSPCPTHSPTSSTSSPTSQKSSKAVPYSPTMPAYSRTVTQVGDSDQESGSSSKSEAQSGSPSEDGDGKQVSRMKITCLGSFVNVPSNIKQKSSTIEGRFLACYLNAVHCTPEFSNFERHYL